MLATLLPRVDLSMVDDSSGAAGGRCHAAAPSGLPMAVRHRAVPTRGRSDRLLGPADIRQLAERLGVRPTKTLGQNFVHDPNTVRRIVRAAELGAR